jgi:predicted alpha-1,6-mannanase (GH76 family)
MRKSFIAGVFLALSLHFGEAGVLPGDDFNANAETSAQALQQWYNRKGLWDTTGWWNAANCVEAIEEVIVAENGGPYLKVLDQTFRRNDGKNFLNEFYDDEGWWALAWIRAFDLTGETRYLKMAKRIFADMADGWDAHCDGGIWWKKDRRYKNAIANELFLLTAVRLHQRTPGDSGRGSYLDWATREWTWFKNSGMINPHNLVNDGLNRRCENNGRTTWTYNQGVIIGGLTELYKVTGDTNQLNQAIAIADAAIGTLIYTNGILREACEPDNCHGADVTQFKGIFIRHLTELHDLTRQPAYARFLWENAHSVWFDDRDGSNRFGLRWTGPIDTVDAARHSSAMMAITSLAEPVTANLSFAKGSGSPAFNHEVGVPAATLAWTCNASNTARAGFMQSGPYLASLPAGSHAVHFRMAVSEPSRAATKLVRLDVRENDGGTILATREIAWNQFLKANQLQEFELAFTTTTAKNPLEFRAYWNNAPGSPALTITDVTLGGHHAWTAANLDHDVGQLDGMNAWCADSIRNRAVGYLTRGPGTSELPAGNHRAVFELKVDNFVWDDAKVATLSVAETESGKVIASREVTRKEFRNTLYQPFELNFVAAAGKGYECRTYWHAVPLAPRLTQRSVMIKPLSERLR